jgi:hypothetical protein
MVYFDVLLIILWTFSIGLNFMYRKFCDDKIKMIEKKIDDQINVQAENAHYTVERLHVLNKSNSESSSLLLSLVEKIKVLEISMDALKKSMPLKKIVPAKKGGKK